ncbi:MAG: sigma-70 family RNA polymerase sigma factor [Mariniphaga sp.]|nr:sigma-70 family RNA polymerase sigma factor [Mariniphaga sp.]MDD4225235.1 sigma-70 family RNA polymerase sigma factor [Mariniphaga sp.]
MTTDKKIWDDFRKGENKALSRIYFNHVQMLYRYGKKFTQDDELIKDTIQDLFFDLIRTRKNLGATDNICFYLMASFRRKLARSMNKIISLEHPENDEIMAEIVYSAEHDLIDKEEFTHREQAIKNALCELSPKQREILFYRFTCNFDYDQICEIMRLQYDSARKQVSRALKALKEILSESDLFLFYMRVKW